MKLRRMLVSISDMRNLVILFISLVAIPTLSFPEIRTFSVADKNFAINDLNKYCEPESGSTFDSLKKQFSEAAKASGIKPNLIHLYHCIRTVTDGEIILAPAMWIRVHENKMWDTSISDEALQKFFIDGFRSKIGAGLPKNLLERIEEYADKLRPKDMSVNIGDPFILKNRADYLSIGTLNEEIINGTKTVTLTQFTFQAIDNELFYIYVASPVHKDLPRQTEIANDLYFVAKSLKAR